MISISLKSHIADMFTLIEQFKGGCKRHLVVVTLVALMAVEVLSLTFSIGVQPDSLFSDQSAGESVVIQTQPIQKISEIRGPRIDEEAAMVVAEESLESSSMIQAVVHCSLLPLSIWVFLVAAYVALLLFNFSYTFEQQIRPQWFFELALTVFVLISWYFLDECRTVPWFPFDIMKFGLITFALYAYLFEKKLVETREQAEKTESMF